MSILDVEASLIHFFKENDDTNYSLGLKKPWDFVGLITDNITILNLLVVTIYDTMHVATEYSLLQKRFLHMAGINLHMRLAGPHAQNRLQRSPFAHAAGPTTCENRYSHVANLSSRVRRPIFPCDPLNEAACEDLFSYVAC